MGSHTCPIALAKGMGKCQGPILCWYWILSEFATGELIDESLYIMRKTTHFKCVEEHYNL